MRLSRWQIFTIRLKLRYKVKREYFTLVVPVIIALVCAVYVVHSGLLVPSAFGTGFAPPPPSVNQTLAKEQLLLALESNSSAGAITVSKTPNVNAAKQN